MMDIKEAAKYFLSLQTEDRPIDHAKLHALCYFAQCESLARRNKPLFDSEFEAWPSWDKVHPPCDSKGSPRKNIPNPAD